jgi:hypothetical protein
MPSAEVKKDAFARILVLGAPKAGKTYCLATTLPQPFIINCDPNGSTQGPAADGADFTQMNVTNPGGVGARKQWAAAQAAAAQMVKAGHTSHVVLDTASLLADNLLEDIMVTQNDKRAAYGELLEAFMVGIKRLSELPAHLWVVAHLDPSKDTISGVLPLIAGQSSRRLGAMMADWVCFEQDLERSQWGGRAFLVGPQKSWTGNGRNMRRTCVVEPNAVELLKELGFEP